MTVITATPEVDMTRKITRAKLTKTTCVEADFEQTITYNKDMDDEYQTSGECPYKGRDFAHQDLVDGFKLFNPHFAILCDVPEIMTIRIEEGEPILARLTLEELENDLDKISNIHVRSFSIGGFGDSEGITLSGYKTLPSGKVLNFNSPFIKFEDETDGYKYSIELQHVKDIVSDEVILYLDGKIAPNAQLDLFDEGENEAQ